MNQLILTTLFLLAFLSTTLNAQQISSDAYNTDIIHEDFDTEGKYFKIVTNIDNYFVLDNGDYLLSRNNKDSEYAIIANNSSVTDFVIKTEVRIGPSNNKKASVGIILKAQQDIKGAIIFEINKKKEYRIKQLIGSNYQILSGNEKQDGWLKNKLINGVDEHNFIEIRSEKNIYDIYINSEYLTTIFIPNFNSGSCGLIISPATKARISYFYINTKGESNVVANHTIKNTASVNDSIEELNKRIVILEENKAKLNELNSNNKALQSTEVEVLTAKNTSLANITIEQEKEIKELNYLLTSLKEKVNKAEGLETSNISIQMTVNSLTSEKNSLSSEVKILTTRNSDLASLSSLQEKEIIALNTAIENFRNSSSQSRAANKKLNEKISGLKQKISLEKAANTDLTNDLKKISKSTTAQIKQLTTETNILKNKVAKLQTSNSTLTADLSTEKSAQSEIKNGFSNSLKNKTTEISTLTTELNNAKEKLKSAEKTSKDLKECTTNASTLSVDLKDANTELRTLKTTQTKHDKVTKELNNEITFLSNQISTLELQLQNTKSEIRALEIINTDLKALFIQKDFELNGIKASDMIKETTVNVLTTKHLKNNKVVYAVQLGIFMQTQNASVYKNLDEVWYQSIDNGTYQYLSGEFTSPKEAADHQKAINAKGYTSAYVITITK